MTSQHLGASVKVTVTRTQQTVIVVVDGDITPDEWAVVCHDHDLTGRHLAINDYAVDGDRHCWQFTLLPVNEEVEVA